MDESILTSIKKLIGIEEDYTHFDPDIIMCINSVFFILTQIGVGPSTGFSITDKTAKWTDFVPTISKIESVKTYVGFKVKLAFDPPTVTGLLTAMQQQANELEWRLYTNAETTTS